MSQAPLHDVAVVGAGSAGLAAGLSAAAKGAHTLLVERAPELGGNVCQALVHTVCGLYLPEGETARPAHPGLPDRVRADLLHSGAASAAERAGRVWYLPMDPRAFAVRARGWCNAAVSLDLRTRCTLFSLDPDPATPGWLLGLRSERGLEHARARLVIDTSGDAAAAVAAGAALAEEVPDELQTPSYIVELSDVDTAGLTGFGRLGVSHALAGAVRRGELAAGSESVVVRPGPRPGQLFLTLGVPRPRDRSYAPLDAGCRHALEDGARRTVEAVLAQLRRERPAFARCRVEAWPRRLGIRESLRLRGRVELQAADILEGRRRDDEVALSTWPIELWTNSLRARLRHPAGPSSVPSGSLVSATYPRLGMAGRCMAGSHEALGALRVIGTALATGEAVGVAAALAANDGLCLAEIPASRVRDAVAAGGQAIP